MRITWRVWNKQAKVIPAVLNDQLPLAARNFWMVSADLLAYLYSLVFYEAAKE
jgi:hypothetical protein